MRILPIAVFIFFVKITLCHAQTIFPRAGVAISTRTLHSNAPTVEVRPRTSFLFGIGAEFHFGKKLELLTEIDYVSRSYQVYNDMAFGAGWTVYDVVYRHNYIDFPIMLKRYFGTGAFKFYPSAGVYVGAGVGGKKNGRQTFDHQNGPDTYINLDGEIRYGADPDNARLEFEYYDNRIDFGILAGAGLVLYKVAVIDFRYGLGLVNIDESESGFKNRTFQIALSVPLKFHPIE